MVVPQGLDNVLIGPANALGRLALHSSVRLPKLVAGAPVAQLDRASDFGSDGWGFESSRAY